MRAALMQLAMLAATLGFAAAAAAQTWSPDGRRIAYYFFTDNEDIWVVNVDGERPDEAHARHGDGLLTALVT